MVTLWVLFIRTVVVHKLEEKLRIFQLFLNISNRWQQNCYTTVVILLRYIFPLSADNNPQKVLTFPWIILKKYLLFHEHLSQSKTKFKNICRRLSRANELLIHKKISWHLEKNHSLHLSCVCVCDSDVLFFFSC
jgi:hypothetical protein